ncbi:transmembrane protease serine 2-like [Genypterus blacodes]|uniref:transmembrane protease serine 2-like n=1 Tax=Genypterus blacodes TaxID=154954 RepID=UPI003F758478
MNNPYLDSQDGKWKPHPLSPSETQPQYVHHLVPKPDPLPPPEISHSIPNHKTVKQRCVKFTVAAVISLLLLLLVAGVLLGYYLSSPCARGLLCGDGSCVWESQWCDGVKDCPAGQDESNCVRLHGSSFLLQIYSSHSKSWKAVCSKGWTDQQGTASCHLFGYSKSTYVKSGQQTVESGGGFLIVKSDAKPGAPIMKQLVDSNTCPNNNVVTLHCIVCGSGLNSSRAPGSQLATLGSWPWHVSLQVKGSHRCGGAIITPYWIVTAAHCVVGHSDPKQWAVYAGIVDPLGPLFNPAHSLSQIVAHEGYNTLTQRNDIALLKLSTPLDFTASRNIAPVCLPNVGLNMTIPQKCWITRFSSSINGDSGSPYLTEAQVSLVDSANCNSSLVYNGRISQDMLCAREIKAGVHTCHADSGGPLVSQKDGVWWLIGDTVWGDDCTEHNKPGVYGDVTHFLSWIYHQMRVR